MNYISAAELYKQIEENIINPYKAEEVKKLCKSRERWKRVSNITETLGHIFILIGSILAFATGIYNNLQELAFASGCVSTSSIALLRFSSYAANESKDRNNLLNIILSEININPLPSPVSNITRSEPPSPNRNQILTTPVDIY